MKDRPQFYSVSNKDHDRLRNIDFLTKMKINVDTAMNTPGYAYRGMKGDPDFNFFEYLKVSKIPYYMHQFVNFFEKFTNIILWKDE